MSVRPWTDAEAARADALYEQWLCAPVSERMRIVAAALDRSVASVVNRRHNNGGCFQRINTGRAAHKDIPEATAAEREWALSHGPRDLTAAVMGDPLPGRSALERRT